MIQYIYAFVICFIIVACSGFCEGSAIITSRFDSEKGFLGKADLTGDAWRIIAQARARDYVPDSFSAGFSCAHFFTGPVKYSGLLLELNNPLSASFSRVNSTAKSGVSLDPGLSGNALWAVGASPAPGYFQVWTAAWDRDPDVLGTAVNLSCKRELDFSFFLQVRRDMNIQGDDSWFAQSPFPVKGNVWHLGTCLGFPFLQGLLSTACGFSMGKYFMPGSFLRFFLEMPFHISGYSIAEITIFLRRVSDTFLCGTWEYPLWKCAAGISGSIFPESPFRVLYKHTWKYKKPPVSPGIYRESLETFKLSGELVFRIFSFSASFQRKLSFEKEGTWKCGDCAGIRGKGEGKVIAGNTEAWVHWDNETPVWMELKFEISAGIHDLDMDLSIRYTTERSPLLSLEGGWAVKFGETQGTFRTAVPIKMEEEEAFIPQITVGWRARVCRK